MANLPTFFSATAEALDLTVWKRARAASDAGLPTDDSRRLALLDLQLHSTRRTVTPHWNDLTVIGAA